MTNPILQFVHRRLYRIRGFLHPIDAMAFSALFENQKHHKLGGGMVEIGVFFGRSLTLMAQHLVRGQEKALGIDLFDIGEHPDADSDQLAYVKRVTASEKLSEDVVLLKANSGDLTPDAITRVVGQVRFFSIDGGHELKDIVNDSALALASLAPHGVIAFDDFFNPQYPDLSVGVIEFLKAHKQDVAAFCITKNKLYVCRTSHYAHYLAAMKSAQFWGNAYQEHFTFLDREIVHWTQSLINRILYQKTAECGLGKLGNCLTRTTRRKFTR